MRVWDSTAELRYLVLPERPAGTEKLSEEELAALVTRDAMVGVAKVTPPQGVPRMNGVHDMGGMQGMGPIEPRRTSPCFTSRWEGRAFALNACHGRLAQMEHRRQSPFQHRADPSADYLRMSYYEKWFVALVELLVKTGLVTRAEIESGKPAPGRQSHSAADRRQCAAVCAREAAYAASRDVPVAPRFQAGPARARAQHAIPSGTRACRVTRAAKPGTIDRRPRRFCVSRHERAFSRREAAACLLGSLRRARVVGRAGLATRFRLH